MIYPRRSCDKGYRLCLFERERCLKIKHLRRADQVTHLALTTPPSQRPNLADSMASVNALHNDERNSFEDYKVKVWLDLQPTRTSTVTKSATELEVSPLTCTSFPSHKRKRDDSDHTPEADRRRSLLRETTMNSHLQKTPSRIPRRG